MKGVIKKLMEKGFGFITPEEGGKDLFFHRNSLVDVRFEDLQEGDTVTFEVEDSPKGPNAVNVKRVDAEAAEVEMPMAA
jgi:cold shock protein